VIEAVGVPARTRRRSSYWRMRSVAGVGYAAPTAVMVTVFFLVPLVLVFWMSMNDWKLLGTPTYNFPDNYSAIPKDVLLKSAVGFTLKYTAIVTVVLPPRRCSSTASTATAAHWTTCSCGCT
jgi:multiple sugar transport system permease protein